MWADTLLDAERGFLIRFGVWGALSVGLGLLLLLALRTRRRTSPLATHFAVQTGVWGAIALGASAWGWSRLHLRDHDGARELYQVLGAALGLDLALVLIGASMALVGWVLGRRLSAVGAGVGMLVQGIGWFALHLAFATWLRAAL